MVDLLCTLGVSSSDWRGSLAKRLFIPADGLPLADAKLFLFMMSSITPRTIHIQSPFQTTCWRALKIPSQDEKATGRNSNAER